jgi:hypothetical protein
LYCPLYESHTSDDGGWRDESYQNPRRGGKLRVHAPTNGTKSPWSQCRTGPAWWRSRMRT